MSRRTRRRGRRAAVDVHDLEEHPVTHALFEDNDLLGMNIIWALGNGIRIKNVPFELINLNTLQEFVNQVVKGPTPYYTEDCFGEQAVGQIIPDPTWYPKFAAGHKKLTELCAREQEREAEKLRRKTQQQEEAKKRREEKKKRKKQRDIPDDVDPHSPAPQPSPEPDPEPPPEPGPEPEPLPDPEPNPNPEPPPEPQPTPPSNPNLDPDPVPLPGPITPEPAPHPTPNLQPNPDNPNQVPRPNPSTPTHEPSRSPSPALRPQPPPGPSPGPVPAPPPGPAPDPFTTKGVWYSEDDDFSDNWVWPATNPRLKDLPLLKDHQLPKVRRKKDTRITETYAQYLWDKMCNQPMDQLVAEMDEWDEKLWEKKRKQKEREKQKNDPQLQWKNECRNFKEKRMYDRIAENARKKNEAERQPRAQNNTNVDDQLENVDHSVNNIDLPPEPAPPVDISDEHLESPSQVDNNNHHPRDSIHRQQPNGRTSVVPPQPSQLPHELPSDLNEVPNKDAQLNPDHVPDDARPEPDPGPFTEPMPVPEPPRDINPSPAVPFCTLEPFKDYMPMSKVSLCWALAEVERRLQQANMPRRIRFTDLAQVEKLSFAECSTLYTQFMEMEGMGYLTLFHIDQEPDEVIKYSSLEIELSDDFDRQMPATHRQYK